VLKGSGGELNAALAQAVVRLHHDYMGRGPSAASAFFRENVVVVVVERVMTAAERSLAESGRRGGVRDVVFAISLVPPAMRRDSASPHVPRSPRPRR